MTNLDRALAEISAIRGQVARATEFRGFGPVTSALTGALAVAGALAQAVWLKAPASRPLDYLKLWIAVATVAVAVVGAEVVTRSRRMHSSLAEEMIRSAIEQLLPAAAAGALITGVLFRFARQTVWMLPGLWQILFGLGVFASGRVLPRTVQWAGAWYLATGLACLALAQGGRALSPWAMGASFGVGQCFAALLLQRSLTAGEHDPRDHDHGGLDGW